MTIEPTTGRAGLIDRVKNILLTPRAEWDRIVGEPADVNKLYLGYVLPLAAVSAICTIIGWSMIGLGVPGFYVRVPIFDAVVGGVIQIACTLAGVYLIAIVANALAPNFGSTQDQGQAHKLMAYSFTASLLAGVFTLHPVLSILGLLGLYSFVLLFLGLPKLMKTPADKQVGYFATLVVVGIIVFFVIGAVTGYARMAVGGFSSPGLSFGQQAPPRAVEGQVTLPNGETIEMSEIEKLGQAAASSGGGVAVEPSALQAMLPQNLPGSFVLASSSASSAMGMTQAEGVYERGDARLTLTVVNMGQMGAMASMAGAMGVTESRQDADGYRRTNTVDGRLITEEISRSSNTASYAVVGRGVAVTAEGRGGVTVDEARGAVEAVGVTRLEAMSGG